MVKTLYDLFEFVDNFPPAKAVLASDVRLGDVVVCFDERGKPTKCGTVKHVAKNGHITLPHGHVDGRVGEVFVLDSSRATVRKGTPLTGNV